MSSLPIRVLHVIGQMNVGGAETLIMNLYRHIDRSLVQFDFVENTMEPSAFDEEIRSLGGRIFNCPHYTGKNHISYNRWWKNFFKMHAKEYTAVHGHIGSTAAFYLRQAKKFGLFTIAHSHGANGTGFKSSLYRVLSFPTRFIADRFFICSPEAGLDRYGKRVCSDPGRCFLLRNAIDVKRYAYNEELRKKTRAAWHIADDALVIGHVGRFVKEKNHAFLIDFFAAMHRRNPRARLLLVGLEDPEKQIRAKVEDLGLTEQVIFAGVQSDTAPFYQAMDLFVLPSLSEGLPLVMVEAQCAGLPCVISDKVPTSCILVKELITQLRLADGAEEWAEHLSQPLCAVRRDCSDEIAQRGFDIQKIADWLQQFYSTKREA